MHGLNLLLISEVLLFEAILFILLLLLLHIKR